MSQIIDLSSGATEYTWPITITETDGKDISQDTVNISFGDPQGIAPGTWVSPDSLTKPQTDTIIVKALMGPINNNPSPGDYWIWIKIQDLPETIIRKVAKLTIV